MQSEQDGFGLFLTLLTLALLLLLILHMCGVIH